MAGYFAYVAFTLFLVGVSGQTPDPAKLQPIGPVISGKQFYYTPTGSGGERLNWLGGLHYCQKYGMDLAQFDSLAEMQSIGAYITVNPGLWVGGNVMDKFRVPSVLSSAYKWFPTGGFLLSSLWGPGEPNRIRGATSDGQFDYESCAAIRSDIKNLNDATCFTSIFGSLCQQIINPAPIPTPDPTKLRHFLTLGTKEFYYTQTGSGAEKSTWLGALQFCREQGLQLADFSSLNELQAVSSGLASDPATSGWYFWLGGNAMEELRTASVPAANYKWFSNGLPVPSQMWGQGEPNRLKIVREDEQYDYESCTELRPKLANFNDGSCFNLRAAVCQKIVTLPATTTVAPTTTKVTTAQPVPTTQVIVTTPPTTTTTTTMAPPTTTIAPTTPGIQPPFACTQEGLYPHPEECTQYYRCLQILETLYTFTMTCPVGKYYDAMSSSCVIGTCSNPTDATPSPTTMQPLTPSPTTAVPLVGCGIKGFNPDAVIRLPQPLKFNTPPDTELWQIATWNAAKLSYSVYHPHLKYLSDSINGGYYGLTTSSDFPLFREEQGAFGNILYRPITLKCVDGSSARYMFEIELVD